MRLPEVPLRAMRALGEGHPTELTTHLFEVNGKREVVPREVQ